ncbi:PadR family transcriptional regulator [Actinoplanes sp. NPDC020271]|uniref:PadR family transcriptional regulator n=1 Tax=Actinoplanes sp. NPDC020271 TaxID=3363896 RepID=UPI00378770AD
MASRAPRMTQATKLVLRTLLAEPSRELYGLEICESAGLPSGTIHPILARLEGLGWLESHWEDTDPAEAGRPRRRYYRLSADGALLAAEALQPRTRRAPVLPVVRPWPGIAGGDA